MLLGQFRRDHQIADGDRRFCLAMMERDDISLVLEGLYPDFSDHFSLDLLEATFQDTSYRKFRIFDRIVYGNPALISYKEREKSFTMQVCEFVTYLKMKQSGATGGSLDYTDEDGAKKTIASVKDVTIYMIDVDLTTKMPQLDRHYTGCFRMPEILPGGQMCMTNGVSCSYFVTAYVQLPICTGPVINAALRIDFGVLRSSTSF